MRAQSVTHRLVRHAKRVSEVNVVQPGAETLHVTEVEYDAVCACSRVFTAPTETEVSARYLAHLPKPTKAD